MSSGGAGFNSLGCAVSIETSYRLNGVEIIGFGLPLPPEMLCPVLCPPPGSSAEVKTLLGEDFAGRPQQRLLVGLWPAIGGREGRSVGQHLERELKALTTSRFPPENRGEFAHRDIFPHYPYGSHKPTGTIIRGSSVWLNSKPSDPSFEAELADRVRASPKGALGSGFPSLEQPISQTLVRLVYVSRPQPDVNPDKQ